MLVSGPPCYSTLRLVQGLKRLSVFYFRDRAIVHQLLDECLKTSRNPAPYSPDLKRGWVKMHVIRGIRRRYTRSFETLIQQLMNNGALSEVEARKALQSL